MAGSASPRTSRPIALAQPEPSAVRRSLRSVVACWHSPHTVRVRKLLLTCVPIAIALVLMQLRPLVINGLFPCADVAAFEAAEPEPEPEPEPTLDGDACAGRKRFFDGELNELVSALLSVFGIVYGLAVSQTSAACAARNDNFRECIFNEAACMKRIALLVQSNLDNAASRESELLRVSVTPEALPEPHTNGEQRRSLAVAVKHSLENHALVLWDDFVLAMNPYFNCCRVHDRKEAASEDKDALEQLANAVITLGRLSSQAEDIAGARAAERAEEACWELMKENHRRKGMISDPILTTMTLLYLASLSGCMFFGVLMLESGSPRFDIAVCLFTVVVIFLSHAIILGGDPSVSSDRLHFKDYADLPQWLQVHQVKNARRQRSRTIDKEGFKILLRSQASSQGPPAAAAAAASTRSIRLSQIGTPEPSCDDEPPDGSQQSSATFV